MDGDGELSPPFACVVVGPEEGEDDGSCDGDDEGDGDGPSPAPETLGSREPFVPGPPDGPGSLVLGLGVLVVVGSDVGVVVGSVDGSVDGVLVESGGWSPWLYSLRPPLAPPTAPPKPPEVPPFAAASRSMSRPCATS
ncbi:hypothetical protein AB0J52_37970, partial [Spirillospora sp. NPDC049652]